MRQDGGMTDWIALQSRAADLYDEVLPAVTDWDVKEYLDILP